MSTTTAVDNRCPHCGGIHLNTKCPNVKAIEYFPDGTVKRVEYMTPGDYAPASPARAWPTRDPHLTFTPPQFTTTWGGRFS